MSRRIADSFVAALRLQSSYSQGVSPEMLQRQELMRDLRNSLALAAPSLFPSYAPRELRLAVKEGGRQSAFAPVPWVRLYSRTHSKSAMTGFYLVYLLAADGSRFYISLNQGTSEFRSGQMRPINDPQIVRTRVHDARRVLERSVSSFIRLGLYSIDLRSSAMSVSAESVRRMKNYEHGNILAREYLVSDVPNDEELLADLKQFIPLLLALYGVEPLSSHPFGGLESETHKRIKEYVRAHPQAIGLDSSAVGECEYRFITSFGDPVGDRVDVNFIGGGWKRTVVEVEVLDERYLTVGLHQAIKYRALAGAEIGVSGQALNSTVRAVLVAPKVDFARLKDLARHHEVVLIPITLA